MRHRKYFDRPFEVDCYACEGRGEHFIYSPKTIPCENCLATGLDPIPWSELFKNGREFFGPYEPEGAERFGGCPRQEDCKKCEGYGFQYFGEERRYCSDCLGLGLDLIPWTELHRSGSHAKWKGRK